MNVTQAKTKLERHTEDYRYLVGDWHDKLKTLPPARLEELTDACLALNGTNCGWWQYNAAQQLLDLIASVSAIRHDLPDELRAKLDPIIFGKRDVARGENDVAPPRVLPGTTRLLDVIARNLGETEGDLAIVYNPDRGEDAWNVSVMFGREAPDSPMAAGHAIATGPTLEDALRQAVDQASWT
jgi:hypothetical protein